MILSYIYMHLRLLLYVFVSWVHLHQSFTYLSRKRTFFFTNSLPALCHTKVQSKSYNHADSRLTSCGSRSKFFINDIDYLKCGLLSWLDCRIPLNPAHEGFASAIVEAYNCHYLLGIDSNKALLLNDIQIILQQMGVDSVMNGGEVINIIKQLRSNKMHGRVNIIQLNMYHPIEYY